MVKSQGTMVNSEKGGIIPANLADRWELLVDEAAKRLNNKRKQIKEAIGSRPYKGMPVDENELRRRWMEIRRDPNAIFEVFAENVRFTKDGRALLPNELVNAIYKGEGKIVESGIGVQQNIYVMALDSEGRPVYGTPEGNLRQAIATLERQQMRNPTAARAAKIAQMKQKLKNMGVDYTKGLAVSVGGNDNYNIPDITEPESESYVDSAAGAQFAAQQAAALQASEQAHAEKMARLDAELQAAAAAGDFERQKQLQELQQQFEREQEDRRREFEKQQAIEQRKQERLQIYTELLGKDPVRATLYAMGVGGELTGVPGFNVEELGPIEGVDVAKRRAEVESAINQNLLKYGARGGQPRRVPGTRELYQTPPLGEKIKNPVSLSGEGVSGLPSIQQAARALQYGDEATRTVLGSAYGVGNKQSGGLSPEEQLRLIEEVTPKGSLRY